VKRLEGWLQGMGIEEAKKRPLDKNYEKSECWTSKAKQGPSRDGRLTKHRLIPRASVTKKSTRPNKPVQDTTWDGDVGLPTRNEKVLSEHDL
jgi:hypothetical protein